MLNPTSDLLSHCHRRVGCAVCTSGSLRTERGWVTQWIWGFGGTMKGVWRSAMGKRQCELEGCSESARTGGHCKAHGRR
jgi:hypothetical protein